MECRGAGSLVYDLITDQGKVLMSSAMQPAAIKKDPALGRMIFLNFLATRCLCRHVYLGAKKGGWVWATQGHWADGAKGRQWSSERETVLR